jgi:hypothetical protein
LPFLRVADSFIKYKIEMVVHRTGLERKESL